MTKTEKSSIRQGTKAGLLHLPLEREKLSELNLYTRGSECISRRNVIIVTVTGRGLRGHA